MSFCNFDFGSTGTCEDCSEFSERDACFDDGLPMAGANDCAQRCFGVEPPDPESSSSSKSGKGSKGTVYEFGLIEPGDIL